MNLQNLKNQCSLNDCKELKELIVKNPELPLIVFVSEDANRGDYAYVQSYHVRAYIDCVTLYKETWMEEDQYEEEIQDELADDEAYVNLSDEEFDQAVKKKVEETEFVKAICVYVE